MQPNLDISNTDISKYLLHQRIQFGHISYLHLHFNLSQTIQSVPQDQKSVTFSHSVISLNQLLQNSKNTAYIFLTFRNHVKIFLSEYFARYFKCCIPYNSKY